MYKIKNEPCSIIIKHFKGIDFINVNQARDFCLFQDGRTQITTQANLETRYKKTPIYSIFKRFYSPQAVSTYFIVFMEHF